MELVDQIYYLACFLQSTIVFINLSAYFPKWLLLLRTKTTEGVAVGSWLIWLLASVIGLFYAIIVYIKVGYGMPLILTYLVGVLSNLFTLLLIFRYRACS